MLENKKNKNDPARDFHNDDNDDWVQTPPTSRLINEHAKSEIKLASKRNVIGIKTTFAVSQDSQSRKLGSISLELDMLGGISLGFDIMPFFNGLAKTDTELLFSQW